MKLFPLLLVAAACGHISNTPPPELPGPRDERDAVADGEWRWRLETDDDGVQRVESERWHLHSSGNAIAGYYDRRVTFRSTTGVPFECNNATEYTLRARYTVEGSLDGATIILVELSNETVASPCERGERKLTPYSGRLDGNHIELTWATGKQTLEWYGPALAPEQLPRPKPRVDGAWSWATAGQSERWTLAVTDGVVTGSYDRSVTRDDCTIVWRYTVRGTHDGSKVTIAETDVEALPGDCAPDAPRQLLDSARGKSYGDVIVLQWRGGKRQVLRRPDPAGGLP